MTDISIVEKLKAKFCFSMDPVNAYKRGFRDGSSTVIRALRKTYEDMQIVNGKYKGKEYKFLYRKIVLDLVGKDVEKKMQDHERNCEL